MSKYDPLFHHLANHPTTPHVIMTFDEIESVLGFSLPDSARNFPEWWGNEDPKTTRDVQSLAWTLNDRTAEPDLNLKKVRFKIRLKGLAFH